MTEIVTQLASSPESYSAVLLFVDDEPNILSALRRLFRPHGYRILTAESGAAALKLLEQEPVDLILSDMRMPEMDGAQLLEQVKEHHPGVIRMLLTGYADMNSTVKAINQGEIYRYLSKPWNDHDLLLTIAEALDRRRLKDENARLLALTVKQNEQLKSLNSALEAKVAAQSAELSQTMAFLDMGNDQLKKILFTMVRVLSGLTEMRGSVIAGHARRVADLARLTAQKMGLEEAPIHEIMLAGLLHDIGKIALPDAIMDKPFNALTQEERALVVKHPTQGAMALMEMEQLRGAAQIIRHHHECYDGSGYPDHLMGEAIPLGARILAVANDYDALQLGTLLRRCLNPSEALTFMDDNKGKRYDPSVLMAFNQALALSAKKEPPKSVTLRISQLRPGMVLAQDFFNPDGYLLLARGFPLTLAALEDLRRLERSIPDPERARLMSAHVTADSAARALHKTTPPGSGTPAQPANH